MKKNAPLQEAQAETYKFVGKSKTAGEIGLL
jgi:hypothetical protein